MALRPALVVRVLGLLVLLYVGWLAATISIANATANARPQLALAVRPEHGLANARMADQILIAERGRDLDRVRELALRSVARDPLQARAFRILASIQTQANRAHSERLLRHAEARTRRDLLTHLLLIEAAVARDDVPGALRHYRVALTTSSSAKDVLFPVLVRAAGEAPIVPQLARMLSEESSWRHELLFRIAGETTPLENIEALIGHVRRLGGPVEDDVVTAFASRLNSAARYADAARNVAVQRGGAALLYNGDFRAPPRLLPFDWELATGGSASADLITGGGQTSPGRLEIGYRGGEASWIARQMLVLAPGRYRFTSQVELPGEAAARGITWQLRCVNGASIMAAPVLGRGEGPQDLVQAIAVPANCPAQWLELRPSGEGGQQWVNGTVRSVAISRVQGA